MAKKKTGYKSVDFLLFLQILRVNFENEEVERFASVLCQAIKNKNFDGIINALLVHFWIRFHFTLEDEKPQMSDVMIIIWEKLEETVLKKTLLSQLKKYAPNLLVSCVAMVYENFFLKCYPNHLWCRKLYNISQPWHPTFRCLSILLLNCFFTFYYWILLAFSWIKFDLSYQKWNSSESELWQLVQNFIMIIICVAFMLQNYFS